ncbi:MAG: T9SS type A sorting domain-containing protein [Bacteroidota bacterium]
MTRWTLLFSIIICLPFNLSGQSLSRSVLSVAGASTGNDQYTVNWTVGEVFGPDALATHHLTTGFQQGKLNSTATNDSISVREAELSTRLDQSAEPVFQAKVYPNPTTDYLYLSLEEALDEDAHLMIFNEQGQQVLTAYQLAVGEKDLLINEVQQLANGVYFIQLFHSGKAVYAAPFIKR